jgi:hypothetical protein
MLYCAHAGCSEEADIQAARSQKAGASFEIVPPPGWSGVREQRADGKLPYEVPALCPKHRPDPRGFLASIAEITSAVRASKGKQGRDIRGRLERCKQAIAMWQVVPPTEDQVTAMAFVIADLRTEAGLPPGLVTGVRRRVSTI